jgi:hypothetical protein
MDANAQLGEFIGTDKYYRYTAGYLLTEGVKEMAERFKCYWLLDVIISYQPTLRNQPVQTWKIFKRKGNTATVQCEDGNGVELKKQHIPFTDFEANSGTIWVIENVLLLPSEY